MAEFRIKIKEALRESAGLDAATATADQIADSYVNLWGSFKKLEARLLKEKDGRVHERAEAKTEWRTKYEAVVSERAEHRVHMEEKLEAAMKAEANLTAELSEARTMTAAVRAHLDGVVATLQVVLERFLMRPHRLMEIYGEETYQAAKDTFVSIGGDATKLPAPEVNRFQEEQLENELPRGT